MRGTTGRRTKSTSGGVRRSGVWSLSRSVWQSGKGKDEEAHVVLFSLCLFLLAVLLCCVIGKRNGVELARNSFWSLWRKLLSGGIERLFIYL